jgi:hypothetical protein
MTAGCDVHEPTTPGDAGTPAAGPADQRARRDDTTPAPTAGPEEEAA